MVACIAAAVLVTRAAAQPAQQTPRELDLAVGKSLVVNSASSVERIVVGDGGFAEARALGPNEVLLNGKAVGETSLIIWQKGGNTLYFDVVVRPNPFLERARIEELQRQDAAAQRAHLDELQRGEYAAKARLNDVQREIQQELPNQPITASLQGDTVVLSGTVKDLASADRAEDIAGATGKFLDLLYVEAPPGADTQILLKVQFATINRSIENQLGLNLFSTGLGNTVGSVSTGQFQTAPAGTSVTTTGTNAVTLSQALNLFMLSPGLNLAGTLKALETKDLAEILAEPNVLAINGKQASFLAGGEFPYPVIQGGQAGTAPSVTIAFKQFGVRIDFLPVITSRGTIRLAVAPEVSALDYTNGVTISGFTVPGLDSRKLNTEIELQNGQSFAIGGLLDKRLTETINKIPLLSAIPLLGKLFQSRDLLKQNSDLLVIITPEIVQPIPAGQKLPQLDFPKALPDDPNNPRTPGIDVTGTSSPSAERIPVADLRLRMQKENDIKLNVGSASTVGNVSQPGAGVTGGTGK
jgi:pilus assembly protein CpaC